jgi:hypothetical protein
LLVLKMGGWVGGWVGAVHDEVLADLLLREQLLSPPQGAAPQSSPGSSSSVLLREQLLSPPQGAAPQSSPGSSSSHCFAAPTAWFEQDPFLSTGSLLACA